MERVLVWIQTLTILCPMLAPIIGAFLLEFISWRGLFVVLILCGILGLILCFFLKETLTNATEGSALRSLTRIGFVLKNKGILILLFTFSLIIMPVMSFLSTSSFIYMDLFKLSAQEYSYFFAWNGCADPVSQGASKNSTRPFSDDLFRLCRGVRCDDPYFRNAFALCLCLPLYSGYLFW